MAKDVKELPQELSFISDIYEILSRLEVGENIDSLTMKITELNKKFDQAKQEIKSTKGINSTKERQEVVLKSLQQQLKIKTEILDKYKNFKLSTDN